MQTEIVTDYRQRAERAEKSQHQVQQQIYRISLLRVVLFVGGIAAAIALRHDGWWAWGGALAVTMLPFLALVKYHNRLFRRKDYLEKEAEINRQELAALTLDTSAFDDGAEYIDPAHLYAFDLDVYGPRTLFPCLNRTCTQPGRSRLAAWLGQHLENKEEIETRQAAVQELSTLTDFRQRFRILGLLHKGKTADEAELQAWSVSPTTFRCRPWLRVLPYVVGGTNALCLLLVLAGIMPASVWGTLWIAFVMLSFLFTGKVTRVQNVYGKKLQILGTYARLLRLMDGQPLQSKLLADIKEESGRASHAILRLSKLMNELDQRNNYLMYTVLNGTFFWELWQIMRIERWKEQYAASLPAWLDAIGRMDALLSLATFAYNHPDYTYPTLIAPTDEPFRFRATALGHPLMPADRCVRNDFEMTHRPEFIIITGANMAGKSTYLRTVGINYLLACIGAPVCATEMELTPVRLVTSLRTSDSLTDNESYFFAELKRLKLIIDKLQQGERLFIILDEILKGTNSTDKQKGSLALIRQFMTLRANGIIATHDLALGTLADAFPGQIHNRCFEADITGDTLTFSYRLREGVAQNMNACFLMGKMGIAMVE